jgi:hypothetical protein
LTATCLTSDETFSGGWLPYSCSTHATKLSVVTPIGGLMKTERTALGLASAGAALGYVATADPLVLLTVPISIVLVGAAVGVAEGLRIRLRAHVLRRVKPR